MPIYEYRCQACGHDFEKLMRMGAEPPPCPECGAEQIMKKVSAGSFVLRGGGWYRDHYGLKSGASKQADAPAGEAGASSSSSSSSDSGGGSSGPASSASSDGSGASA